MTYRIIRVHIVNRDDTCCYDRLIGAVVRAGNDEDHLQNPICGEPIGLDNRGEIVINCPGRMLGRYVSVDIPDRTDPLSICEAEVYGQDIRNCSDGDAAEFETLPCCPGYELQQSKCVDIDECLVYQRFCKHECVNTPGSFYCECNHGYRLSTDRRSCQASPIFKAFTVPKDPYNAALTCESHGLSLVQDTDEEKHQRLEDYICSTALEGENFWFDARAYTSSYVESSDGTSLRPLDLPQANRTEMDRVWFNMEFHGRALPLG
ncbi:uncharacterized protein [Ptychodera flava]|uniref:uncharacterized protein n=1 Tax=Ptychodera flava TaxID=63121 RepID=UPI00396A6F99